jgi:hypothetical protein
MPVGWGIQHNGLIGSLSTNFTSDKFGRVYILSHDFEYVSAAEFGFGELLEAVVQVTSDAGCGKSQEDTWNALEGGEVVWGEVEEGVPDGGEE